MKLTRKLIIPAIAAGAMLAVGALPASAAISRSATPSATTRTAAPRSSITADSVTYYQIINHDGKCLDETGGSTANGVAPQQWACNGNPQQYWAVIYNDTGYALIKNYNSGKCLSILDNNSKGGAAVIQWTCDNADAWENWDPYYTGSGDWFIYYNTASCSFPESDSCGMHPDGNQTGNGWKIYDQVVSSTAYYWKTGGAA